MGLLRKIRRRIKKIIPKEIRPALPYIAAAIPGLGMGIGALGAKSAMGSFLRAGIAKGLTDDEANLGDVFVFRYNGSKWQNIGISQNLTQS